MISFEEFYTFGVALEVMLFGRFGLIPIWDSFSRVVFTDCLVFISVK